jgi:Rhodopirellula transposase DDE domain
MSRRNGSGGRERGANQRFPRACPRDGGGPDAAFRSRSPGRTDDPRGSGIAAAVDLQERAPYCAGAASAGSRGQPHLVGHSLSEAGYSLQGNCKTTEGDSHPDRDAQFGYINTQVFTALAEQQPGISVDTKKKELVGDFRNNGREYRPQGNPEEVRVHDFLIKELGRAVPYGIDDLAANSGWVSVGH